MERVGPGRDLGGLQEEDGGYRRECNGAFAVRAVRSAACPSAASLASRARSPRRRVVDTLSALFHGNDEWPKPESCSRPDAEGAA